MCPGGPNHCRVGQESSLSFLSRLSVVHCLLVFVQVIMVRGRRGGRRWGARGGGVTPLVASMPKGSNP
jgi:hypothetical protein